ncbi:MAG: hypothetical protein ABUT39_19630 [Acidobacteriota bacterium]
MSLATPFSRTGRILKYHNEDVFLAGRYPGIGDLPNANYDLVLRKLAVQRNNFFRHWIMAYWNYSRPGNDHSPFSRGSDGKWNLKAPYNAEYFRRLDLMIRAAQHHGIVVQLTLFDVPGLKAGVDRWGNNPWNQANNVNGFIVAADGIPEFYANSAPLRAVQKSFVEQVVGATMKYWNVCYEIINEGGGGDAAAQEARVRWFDTVTGWIHGKTGGGRMIFHNDHSAGAQEGNDVKFWKTQGYPNYPRLDGVIFHFNPLTVSPDAARYDAFNKEKIFQVSTDAFDLRETPDDDRETSEWNAEAIPVLYARKVMYQAEAGCPDVGRAIGQAVPSPTDLRLGRFTHVFRGALGQAQIQRRFFMDAGLGFYIDYGSAGEVGRGRVEAYAFEGAEQRIRLMDTGNGTSAWWRYTFSASGDTLTLVNLEPGAATTLTLQRVRRAPLDGLIPFLYNWARVADIGSSVAETFELRFDVDGAVRTFRRNPDQEMDHFDVRAVDTVAKKVTLVELSIGTAFTYRYSFERLRSGVRRLRLVNEANGANLLFEERAWYIPPTMAAAASTGAEPALT